MQITPSDTLHYGEMAPDPRIFAFIGTNRVGARQFPYEAEVTLTIDDPETPEPVDYTGSGTIESDDPSYPWGGYLDFTLVGLTIEPGMVLTMTDQVVTKTMTVQTLEVDEANSTTDTISGWAEPGIRVRIRYWCGENGEELCLDTGVWSDETTGYWSIYLGEDMDIEDGQEFQVFIVRTRRATAPRLTSQPLQVTSLRRRSSPDSTKMSSGFGVIHLAIQSR